MNLTALQERSPSARLRLFLFLFDQLLSIMMAPHQLPLPALEIVVSKGPW